MGKLHAVIKQLRNCFHKKGFVVLLLIKHRLPSAKTGGAELDVN